MGYRKKALRLEIRRGENGGYVAINTDAKAYLVNAGGIISALGEEFLDAYLRPTKAPKEQKPPEPSPPAEGAEDVPPP